MTSVVLVIDDEPDIEFLFRQQFRGDLRARLFDMDFARSAAHALRRAVDSGERKLALILSDVTTPGMSGLDMLPQMRARLPHVPVIMVSAHADNQTRAIALKRGAEDLLAKPIDFGRLRQKIEAALRADA